VTDVRENLVLTVENLREVQRLGGQDGIVARGIEAVAAMAIRFCSAKRAIAFRRRESSSDNV